MNLKPASGTRGETMPAIMGVSQGMGTIQSESLGGSAASGGGVGGGHGVRNGFSLDESEVVLTCGKACRRECRTPECLSQIWMSNISR